MEKHDELTIGEVAERCGLAPSAIRYYDDLGLIDSTRTSGNQRRYTRASLRRIAVIRAGQRVGLSLDEVRAAFSELGTASAPTKAQWGRLARQWRPALEARIRDLQRIRDDLDGCIGCGCLSLKTCRLYNPDDVLGEQGEGPVLLFDDGRAGRTSG